MYQAVFAYPILPGKTELQRQYLAARKEKASDTQYQNNLLAYRSGMGWTDVRVWIQKLPKEDLHILLLQSDRPINSEQIHSRFCKRYENGCPMAKEVRSIYLETQGMDFCDQASYATFKPLPDFPIDFTEEELADKTITEYAYACPLLAGQSNRILEYNQRNLDNPDRLAYFKAMRKRLGLTEVHGWIQYGFGRKMIVMQQKVIEPFSKACDNWHDAVSDEEVMQKHTEFYSQATGLDPNEMIPDLEAL